MAELDLPLLNALEPDARALMTAAARVATVPAGTVLFRDGAECQAYVLVIEGSVRVQKVAETGREIVLYRVEGGQSCVLTTNCLLAAENYSAEGVAETDIRALTLPAGAFRQLLAMSEAFRQAVFASYATRMSDLLMLIEEVAFGRVDMRLAQWLADRGAGGEIRATHQEVAVELGTAREVVSRQLKEFERKGWVSLGRGRIEVANRAALLKLSGSVT